MSDETASTIILVGAIFQILASIIILFLGGAGFLIPIIFGGTIGLWILVPAFFFTGGIISVVFTILWLSWRHEASDHKIALIITGFTALIVGGFLPGLFVVIGGAIAGGNGA
ncbi:MAG: hypothetical protein ACFE8O_04440 [Candidatus Hermodarchaeota archaeon]